MVADVLTWLGLKPTGVGFGDAGNVAMPPLVQFVWIGMRQLQYTYNNQRPQMNPTTTTAPPGGPVTGDLNATDYEGDTITYTVTKGPVRGSVAISSDGKYVYTPSDVLRVSGGTDSFEVSVDDTFGNPAHLHGLLQLLGLGGPASAQVAVSIAPRPVENTAPIVGEIPFSITTAAESGIVRGVINATDGENDPLTFSSPDLPASTSVFTVDSTGSFVFIPTFAARNAARDQSGPSSATFTVVVSDGRASTLTTITVPIVPTTYTDETPVTAADLETMVSNGTAEVGYNDDLSVQSVIGRVVPGYVVDVTSAAAAFNRLAGLLSAGPNFATATEISVQEVDLSQSQSDPSGREVFYRLSYSIGGSKVIGSDIILSTDANGTVTGLYSGYDVTLGSILSQERISDESAARSLNDYLKTLTPADAPPAAGAPRLVILAPQRLLGYEITVPVSTDNRQTSYYVIASGAHAGEILPANILNGSSASASAEGLDGEQHRIEFSTQNDEVVLVDSTRGIIVVSSRDDYYGESRRPYRTEAIIRDPSGHWRADAVSAQASFRAAYDFYLSHFNRRSYDSRGTAFDVLIDMYHDDSKYNGNGGWNYNQKVFLFTRGKQWQQAVDFVGHEYTHAVMDSITNYSGGYHGFETRSLQEAYADIMGSFIEARQGADRWKFGEDVDVQRSMSFDPGRLRAPREKEDEHDYSQFLSHVAYELMTSSAGGLSTIDETKWERVFYRSMHRLPVDAVYKSARAAILGAAKAEGFTTSQLAAMRQIFSNAGIDNPNFLRFVLHWGASPSDLDSHLIGPTTDGTGNFHVFYGNTNVYNGPTRVADLDYDDTTSYGPESTTIRQLSPGEYYFYVYNYSGGGDSALASSGGQVIVYDSQGTLSQTFEIPTSGSGRYWSVCKISVDSNRSITVTPIQQVGYSPITSYSLPQF